MATPEEVVAYYDRKTELILRKYGPGPRVHFHGGLIDPDTVPAPTVEGLRQQLIQSQEDLLHEAARFWEAESRLSGTILDVGCGLGGGSIFWAQEYGVRVFALTNVPRHVELVARFAAQAGVADQVMPILGDACAVPGDETFDAAVAIDSSSYLDRGAWFRHLSPRVRSGGRVLVVDIFAQREDCREPVDRYYKTCIGTLDEYMRASAAVGFGSDGMLALTARSTRYWEFSALYTRRLLEAGVIVEEKEVQRLQRSMHWHTWFLQQWMNGGLIYALLSFVHS